MNTAAPSVHVRVVSRSLLPPCEMLTCSPFVVTLYTTEPLAPPVCCTMWPVVPLECGWRMLHLHLSAPHAQASPSWHDGGDDDYDEDDDGGDDDGY